MSDNIFIFSELIWDLICQLCPNVAVEQYYVFYFLAKEPIYDQNYFYQTV